jgi:hypothetical protein
MVDGSGKVGTLKLSLVFLLAGLKLRLARDAGTILKEAARLRWMSLQLRCGSLVRCAALVLELQIRRRNVSAVDIGDLLGAAIAHRQF